MSPWVFPTILERSIVILPIFQNSEVRLRVFLWQTSVSVGARGWRLICFMASLFLTHRSCSLPLTQRKMLESFFVVSPSTGEAVAFLVRLSSFQTLDSAVNLYFRNAGDNQVSGWPAIHLTVHSLGDLQWPMGHFRRLLLRDGAHSCLISLHAVLIEQSKLKGWPTSTGILEFVTGRVFCAFCWLMLQWNHMSELGLIYPALRDLSSPGIFLLDHHFLISLYDYSKRFVTYPICIWAQFGNEINNQRKGKLTMCNTHRENINKNQICFLSKNASAEKFPRGCLVKYLSSSR